MRSRFVLLILVAAICFTCQPVSGQSRKLVTSGEFQKALSTPQASGKIRLRGILIQDKKVVSNGSEEGRSRNRRVVFRRLD